METRVEIHGLDELRRSFRRISPQLSKTLQVANKKIASRAVGLVKPAVAGLPSPGGSRAAGGITPRATQKSAEIAFSRADRSKPLMATILGANWHPVFGRFVQVDSMSRRLWRPHLGASWTPAQLYGVGPVLEQIHRGFAMDEYREAVSDAIKEAFPQ